MVGRKALSLLSVAVVALALAASASAQTRAPDSGLAGLVFPTQPRDWSSDPGGFKAATLDLAAALTGKACAAEEFHAWTIRDFAAGVTLSEAVDESFRTAGWRLDLVSRDSELSRIYLASRGDDGLILNWMPDEGVVGLLMCVAAEPGSVPERVAEAAPSRPFSLDPTMPPLPLPRPSAEAVAAAAVAPLVADPAEAGAVADPPAAPTEFALAEAPALPAAALPPGDPAALEAAPAAPAPLAQTALVVAQGEAGDPLAPPPAADATAGPMTAAVEPAATAAPAPALAADPLVVGATSPASPLPVAADPPATSPAAPTAVAAASVPAAAAPTPTRTPIDLGVTAAILDTAAPPPGETVTAAVAATSPSVSAMYERVPPPPGLIDPVSVADRTAAIPARPEPVAAPVMPARPVTLLAQGRAIGVEPAEIEAEQIPVTTILAPVLEPGGLSVWPFFLLAVVLAGAGLAIIVRRAVPPVPPPHALWPTALASVVGADLDERVGDAGIEFTPVLRYRFSVGENEFEAVTEGWGGRSLPTRSAAEAVIAGFPDHARVEISYDPTDPTRVMLPEAPRPADPMLMVAAGCLALAALTLVLTLV
jgi:hypothetical protein